MKRILLPATVFLLRNPIINVALKQAIPSECNEQTEVNFKIGQE